MPPVSTLAETAREPARVPVEELFERHFALVAGNAPRHQLIPPDARRAAFAAFRNAIGTTGKGGRDWKYDYTRLASELPWDEAERPVRATAPSPLIEPSTTAAHARSLTPLVQVASVNAASQGVAVRYVRDLASDEDIALRDTLAGSVVRVDGDPLASLAFAFAHDGFLVHVPPRTHVDQPILLEHDAHGSFGSAFPYTLVVVDEGAHATVVEDLRGSGFASGVVEIVLRDRAQLDYVVVQRTAADATLFMSRGAACGAGATVRFFVAELGAGLSRSLLTTRLDGRGAHAEANAIFFNTASQHTELSTLVDHAVGDTTSNTTVKSAARDSGQGRYFGNIRIAEHANGSDAALRDDALLLSEHAHIDSVPALEIASNDVKAFHGATIGSIGEDELFYAQSRGIPRADAERMIALGFFDPVVSRFPVAALRETVRAALAAKAGARAGGETE